MYSVACPLSAQITGCDFQIWHRLIYRNQGLPFDIKGTDMLMLIRHVGQVNCLTIQKHFKLPRSAVVALSSFSFHHLCMAHFRPFTLTFGQRHLVFQAVIPRSLQFRPVLALSVLLRISDRSVDVILLPRLYNDLLGPVAFSMSGCIFGYKDEKNWRYAFFCAPSMRHSAVCEVNLCLNRQLHCTSKLTTLLTV